MSFLDRIEDCTKFNSSEYIPFFCSNIQIGRISLDFLNTLDCFPENIVLTSKRVDFVSPTETYKGRTIAFAKILNELRSSGLVPGWRDELYPVGASFSTPPLFAIERAAVPLFGIKAYGVHLNGYIIKGNKTYLWIGKRSLTKPTGPGKLDQIVAGGQPAMYSLRENLIKECKEEAKIPKHLAIKAKAVGTISYLTKREEGLRDDILFCFDLRLPNDFKPINTDGEVEQFYLWRINKISKILQETCDFKFNSALVTIDFLIRHGFIEADHSDYPNLIKGLHQ